MNPALGAVGYRDKRAVKTEEIRGAYHELLKKRVQPGGGRQFCRDFQ